MNDFDFVFDDARGVYCPISATDHMIEHIPPGQLQPSSFTSLQQYAEPTFKSMLCKNQVLTNAKGYPLTLLNMKEPSLDPEDKLIL